MVIAFALGFQMAYTAPVVFCTLNITLSKYVLAVIVYRHEQSFGGMIRPFQLICSLSDMTKTFFDNFSTNNI